VTGEIVSLNIPPRMQELPYPIRLEITLILDMVRRSA
jgi:hypothetical protein